MHSAPHLLANKHIVQITLLLCLQVAVNICETRIAKLKAHSTAESSAAVGGETNQAPAAEVSTASCGMRLLHSWSPLGASGR